jgi:hypothetical protein
MPVNTPRLIWTTRPPTGTTKMLVTTTSLVIPPGVGWTKNAERGAWQTIWDGLPGCSKHRVNKRIERIARGKEVFACFHM